MSSLILVALFAFLLVDILLIVLVARWGEPGTRSRPVRTTVKEAPSVATNAAAPNELTANETAASGRPQRDVGAGLAPALLSEPASQALEEPVDSPFIERAAEGPGEHDRQETLLAVERSYLRQQARLLETRLAALNEAPDANTDFRRGMKAALEEELHTAWARLSELESEEERVNHIATK